MTLMQLLQYIRTNLSSSSDAGFKELHVDVDSFVVTSSFGYTNSYMLGSDKGDGRGRGLYFITDHPHIGFNAYYDGTWKSGYGTVGENSGIFGYYTNLNRFVFQCSTASFDSKQPLQIATQMSIQYDGDLYYRNNLSISGSGINKFVGGLLSNGIISGSNINGSNTGDNSPNTNAGLVHTTGNETINGDKIFTGYTITNGAVEVIYNNGLIGFSNSLTSPFVSESIIGGYNYPSYSYRRINLLGSDVRITYANGGATGNLVVDGTVTANSADGFKNIVNSDIELATYYQRTGVANQCEWYTLVPAGATTFSIYNGTNGYVASFGLDKKVEFFGNVTCGAGAKIGNSSNCSVFESDGSLYFSGSATVWEDLRFPATAINPAGAPTAMTFDQNNIGFIGSATADQAIAIIAQLPHSWKEGSVIEPHIHWEASTLANQNVIWRLDYRWTNIGESGSFTTINITGSTANSASYTHLMNSFGPISGVGKTISSILTMKIFRLGTATADTYADNTLLKEFDIHYEIDTVGSRTQYQK